MVLKIQKTEYDLSPLFASDDDPRMAEKRKELEKASYGFIDKWKSRDDYLHDPAVLKEALDEFEQWQRNHGSEGDEGYYFWLRMGQDESNPALKAKSNQISDFGNKIANDIIFFELKLSKIAPAIQKIFLEADLLKGYRAYLERLFRIARYALSEPEEKIMTLKNAPAHDNWIRMLSGFLSKEERPVATESGEKIDKSFSEILDLISSTDKIVRDTAAAALNDILSKHAETAENELNSILQNKKINDELRGYSRPDEWRHIADDIDTEAVDALVEAVSGRFDIPQRYYVLKAKLLGVDKLAYHERNVPYGKIDKKYSYEDGVNLVHRVLGNLDPRFAAIFKMFNDNGQIDVYPRKGKRSGAFCSYNLLSQPTYLMLNYGDRLNDVLTLAHETGHGINDELNKDKQHALYFGTSTATAEVASTFMEDFVLEEILKDADDELRLAVLMMKLNDAVSSIFRQIALYRFEQELHKDFRAKGYLSKEEIGGLFRKHMSVYMGDAVIQSPGSENWWVFWSHIRMFFYVYSYASGLLISKSLQGEVKKDRAFIDKIKVFLSSGTSESPKNIFLKMGIDISQKEFWNKGLAEIDKLLAETTNLAAKLGKLK